MREILKLPVYDKSALPELIDLIDTLDELFDEHNSLDKFDDRYHEIKKIIHEKSKRINQLTKKEIDPYIFEGHSSVSSTKEMAAMALIPEPPKITDITIEELTEIVGLFKDNEVVAGNYVDYYLKLLKKSFSILNISDYIFWPNQIGLNLHTSDKEIAAKIFEDLKNGVNKPIILDENEGYTSKPISEDANKVELSEPLLMIISYLKGELSQKDFFDFVYTNNSIEEELSKETDLPPFEDALCEDLFLYLINGNQSNNAFIRNAKKLLLDYLEKYNIDTDFFYKER